jgi:hypothetical protein
VPVGIEVAEADRNRDGYRGIDGIRHVVRLLSGRCDVTGAAV